MNTILVVDDSAVDRRLVGGLLEKRDDWSVEYATSGAEALEKLATAHPDLVITDMMMPEMNGLQLVAKVRSDFPLVPTVLMTSQGNEEIAVEALKKGAFSYVPKSALADELVNTVDEVLAVAGKNRCHSRLMGCMSDSECKFVLENDRTLLSTLVGYFQESISHMGLCDQTDQMRVGIALEEALVNALYHGNLEVSSDLREEDHQLYEQMADERCGMDPYRKRRIYVQASMSPEQATFVIRDEGPGFDPTSLPDPTDPANLERVSGRGVLLMRTFMDKVIFNKVGNEVSLTKYRASDNGQATSEDEPC